jgi:hypothetical protein
MVTKATPGPQPLTRYIRVCGEQAFAPYLFIGVCTEQPRAGVASPSTR